VETRDARDGEVQTNVIISHMLTLRALNARLPAHDKYLSPFPDDIDASFTALLDALDSEQQHHKVAALRALFTKGLLPLAAASDQVDFGHRVLLFLMKIKGRVVNSRVDEEFMRSFMRAVGSKRRKEAELMMEQERVRRLLAEADLATEDGRWWRQAVSYSSDDNLSDWSDDLDDGRGDSGGASDGDERIATGATATVSAAAAAAASDATETPDRRHPLAPPSRSHRLPLPLIREPNARSAHERAARAGQHNHTYSDPQSLAVWLAVKSNPASTHLSECLNPRHCLPAGSFVEQLLNSVLGLEQPGSMIRDVRGKGDGLDVYAVYDIVGGVHTEGVSTGAAAAVAREVLEVANAFKRAELGAENLHAASASAVARQIRACRLQCLEARPRTLIELVRACSAVRHRAIILDGVVASAIDGNAEESAVVKGLIDDHDLLCSSGAAASSMGVLLELLVAGEDVPGLRRADLRRVCREYMDAIVIGVEREGVGARPSPSLESSPAPATRPTRPAPPTTAGWWDDECDEIARDAPLAHFSGPDASSLKSAPASSTRMASAPPFGFDDWLVRRDTDIGTASDSGSNTDTNAIANAESDAKDYYRTMEDTSRRAMDEYRRRAPLPSYSSLESVKASVMGKVDAIFDREGPLTASPAKLPENGAPKIYPLPPTVRLATMSEAAVPRLDASKVALLSQQLGAVQRVCQLAFPYNQLDEDLRPLVESVWASQDASGSAEHHYVTFRAPLAEMLGPEARRGLSAARSASVSLQAAWMAAVDARREAIKSDVESSVTSVESSKLSSNRAEHLRDLATIVRLRDRQQVVDFAFWDFERTTASVLTLGCDAAHVSDVCETINACFVKLGDAVCPSPREGAVMM